jgi:mRNA (guanine-N7-)-methyltransferase
MQTSGGDSVELRRGVADHYNAIAQPNLGTRDDSPILQVKNFNNWVKAVLIRRGLQLAGFEDRTRRGEGPVVLDLCGGKAGDIKKFSRANCTLYVLADVAATSVRHGAERYNAMVDPSGQQQQSQTQDYGNNKRSADGRPRRGPRPVTFPAAFAAGDNFADGFVERVLAEVLARRPEFRGAILPGENHLLFDLVSIQFALHYSFETEARARALLQSISYALRPGGRFVGTIPNAYMFVKRVREAQRQAQEAAGNGDGDGAGAGADEVRSFGNRHYEVRFVKTDEFPLFGAKYFFTLEDAVTDCPEFLVHMPTFVQLAREYGLELDFQMPFHEFFVDMRKDPPNERLLETVKVLDATGTISAEQWEACGIYIAFCFRKVAPGGGSQREATVASNPIAFPRATIVRPEDVIDFSED